MKLKFLIFETKSPAWVNEARAEYAAKISAFQNFEVRALKSPSADRDDHEVKRRKEGELLLKQLDGRDLLILFDEAGKIFASSEDFAKQLGRHLESGKAQIVFVIGGPYGFSQDVRDRSQARWSLSPLTLNHWIAQLAALEQVYRGFTILKGIPYHNR
jgi:23S rRNA (pseudouridine1915-N3)-methyltransferase